MFSHKKEEEVDFSDEYLQAAILFHTQRNYGMHDELSWLIL